MPSAKHIAKSHLTHLTNLLYTSSKGRYSHDKAIQIRDAASNSIGTCMPAKALELKHTIKLIREFDNEISEIEDAIKAIMDKIASPITSIPSLGLNMAAMIIAEIGNFNNFDSPDKILAFAGLSPSTYQSGQLNNCYAHMEKRGSRYLRYALFNTTKYGILYLHSILSKSVQKVNTIMLLFFTLLKSLFGSSLLCKNPVNPTR